MANEKWRIQSASKRLYIDGIEVSGVTAAILNAVASAAAAGLAFITGVTAGTAAASKALVLDAAKGVTGFRTTSQLTLFTQGAANALNATGTLTAAMMLGGIVTSTTAAGVTATLDIGATLDAAILALYPGAAVSDAFEFSVINTGANTFTIATATGWTDGGGFFAAVAAGTSATFRVRRTAASTFTGFKIA